MPSARIREKRSRIGCWQAGRLAEDPRVRFGERGVEMEQATVSEAPATRAVSSRWTVAESPRHPPTLRR